MKRQKKIFALLAAIQMMASLLSIGATAEGATEREENLRNITYLAVANTWEQWNSLMSGAMKGVTADETKEE